VVKGRRPRGEKPCEDTADLRLVAKPSDLRTPADVVIG